MNLQGEPVAHSSMPRLAVLISGRGSNLQAIIAAIGEGRLRARIALVVANVAGAPGLAHADAAGLPTLTLSHRDHPTREAYDRVLAEQLTAAHVDLVCLAGFMRLLTPAFIEAFPQRILNIHPSLLPSFPGLDAQRQALEHGVKVTGATVHLVTAALDAGPILMQRAVDVEDDDTPDTLSARILSVEHRLYPDAIQHFLDGRWRLEGRRLLGRS